MNIELKTLKSIVADPCITIIMNTHRTRPDNARDPITLKNLVKEAETRLLNDYDKRKARALIERLNELASSIDHNQNLESLALFVNEEISQYMRFPIEVVDRCIIDQTFATRDLIRTLHKETSYYILVLNRQKARLLEAYNDKFVREFSGNFPVENEHFNTTDRVDLSISSKSDRLLAEFFNIVDKEVNKVRKSNPLPVLICTDESNYSAYLEVADEKDSLIDAFFNTDGSDGNVHTIVGKAWEIMRELVRENIAARKAELKKAVNQNKFLSDVNEIWRGITEGRVQTLFVEQGLFQPAIIENRHITFVDEDDRTKKDVIDDIYDELIEENLKYGGDVVFLPPGELEKFKGFGAITRY